LLNLVDKFSVTVFVNGVVANSILVSHAVLIFEAITIRAVAVYVVIPDNTPICRIFNTAGAIVVSGSSGVADAVALQQAETSVLKVVLKQNVPVPKKNRVVEFLMTVLTTTSVHIIVDGPALIMEHIISDGVVFCFDDYVVVPAMRKNAIFDQIITGSIVIFVTAYK
jgi:hypothetical protein